MWSYLSSHADYILFFCGITLSVFLIISLHKRKKAEEELVLSENRYRDLFENASDLIQSIDIMGRIEYVNQVWREALGYSDEEVLNLNFYDIIHPVDREKCRQMFKELQCGSDISGMQVTFVAKNGKLIDVEGNVSVKLENGIPVAGRGIFRDVTKKRHDVEALRESESRYRTLFENTTDPILIMDPKGYLIDCNHASCEFFGCRAEDLLGNNLWDLMQIKLEETTETFDKPGHIEKELFLGETSKILELTITPALWKGKKVSLGMGKDVTDRRKAEEKIRFLAYHDTLTGLPNRLCFKERLSQSLTRAKRQHKMLGVLFLDLDRFKIVNDTLGHNMGDRLLQAVASRLTRCVRGSDTVARIGGDEFTILLNDINQIEDCIKISKKIMDNFRKALKVGKREFHLTPSIGIATYPKDGNNPETLLRNADAAMYRAKEQGRENFLLYSPFMSEQAMARMELENALHHALTRNEIEVYYQPQIHASSGNLHGMEALIRWHHPQLGLLYPKDFIPIAEETGLIIPIGEQVIYSVCRQNVEWQKRGYAPLKAAVNLSAYQFKQGNLAAGIEKILKDTGMDANFLELEITESIAMQDVEHTVATIIQLKEMGVHISIDDFGTGYASLSYLKMFPPLDTLKIDSTFVSDIANPDKAAKALVATMIVLAKNLKLKVVAEGVETQEQLDFLLNQGCDVIQGYYFYQPLPAAEFELLIARQNQTENTSYLKRVK